MRSNRILQIAPKVFPASEQDSACGFVYNFDVCSLINK